MFTSSISFLVDCPFCDCKVSATTRLGGSALIVALEQDADVRAIHPSDRGDGDHEWSLSKEEKANLHKCIVEGERILRQSTIHVV